MAEAKRRFNFAWIFAGTNGTGKTTQALNAIDRYPKHKNVVIFDPMFGERKWEKYPIMSLDEALPFEMGENKTKRIRLDVDYSNKKYFERLMEITNSLLVFDDAMFWLNDDPRGRHFRLLYLRRRQLNNDIIFIAHGMSEIPPSFFTFSTHIWLFNTTDGFERSRAKIPNFEAIAGNVMKVNNDAKQNPYAFRVIEMRKLTS